MKKIIIAAVLIALGITSCTEEVVKPDCGCTGGQTQSNPKQWD